MRAEERSVFYVGMIMATSQLIITTADKRKRSDTGHEQDPSPFLASIKPAYPEWQQSAFRWERYERPSCLASLALTDLARIAVQIGPNASPGLVTGPNASLEPPVGTNCAQLGPPGQALGPVSGHPGT